MGSDSTSDRDDSPSKSWLAYGPAVLVFLFLGLFRCVRSPEDGCRLDGSRNNPPVLGELIESHF